MPKRRPIEDRIDEKIIVRGDDECWGWTSTCDLRGYPIVGRGGRHGGVVRAHRVQAERYIGSIEGKIVLHLCNNKQCLNPKHLRIGTQSENIQQMWAEGRQSGGQVGGKRLDGSEVAGILQALAKGERQVDVASRFGVGQATVSRVKRKAGRFAHFAGYG